jgi:hypothetical protein
VYDFAHNGSVQPILSFYKQGVAAPFANRDELIRAIPALGRKYPRYADFATARIRDLAPGKEWRAAEVLSAYTFASGVALNQGEGRFTLRSLPVEAQFAPIYAALSGDFDGDGRVDVIVAGNTTAVPPIRGRYDASYGLLLRGDGAGGLSAVDLDESGLVIMGEVRGLGLVRSAGGAPRIVVARNGAPLQFVRPLRADRRPPSGTVAP